MEAFFTRALPVFVQPAGFIVLFSLLVIASPVDVYPQVIELPDRSEGTNSVVTGEKGDGESPTVAAIEQQTAPPVRSDPLPPAAGRAISSGLQNVSRAFMYSATGFDIGTTFYGLRTGRREANPLLGQNRVRIAVQIVGTTVAADFAATRLARAGHPRWAAFSRFIIGGLHIGASMHNLR
jgi:hypothetical protein